MDALSLKFCTRLQGGSVCRVSCSCQQKKTSQGKLKIPLCTCTYCSMMAATFQDGGLTYLDRSSSLRQIDHLDENIINNKTVTI